MMKRKAYVGIAFGFVALIAMGCNKTAEEELAAAAGLSSSVAAGASMEVVPQTRVDFAGSDKLAITPDFLADSGAVISNTDFKIVSYTVVNSRGKDVTTLAPDAVATNDEGQIEVDLAAIGTGIYYLKAKIENIAGTVKDVTVKIYQTEAAPTLVSWTTRDDGWMVYFSLRDAIDQKIAPLNSVTMSIDSVTDAKGTTYDGGKMCIAYFAEGGVYEVDCTSGITSGVATFSDGKTKVSVPFKVSLLAGLMLFEVREKI